MKNTTLMMCVVAALAIFTSTVDAETSVNTPLRDLQLQVPGCNVNGFVTLDGSIILNTSATIVSNRLYVDAIVNPNLFATTSTKNFRLEGTTRELQHIVYFLNGEATLDFDGSFKSGRFPVRFEIKYKAHVTYRLVGVQPVFGRVTYDNFRFVCL
jgi:hypothetical protein